MSITNFIPTIWSENLLTALDKEYVGVAHCTRDYEGEIKGKGAVVKISSVGNISVGNYTKDTDMENPQPLTDTVIDLEINQAKYFNFQVDDIDKAQCVPQRMEAAMSLAASALANAADRYVFDLYHQAGSNIDCNMATEDILDAIIKARQTLYENNVSDSTEVVLEVSPKIASEIFKKKISLSYCDPNTVDSGYLGSIMGCKIYVSNNIPAAFDSINMVTIHPCIMRTKRAIAFAEQFSEIDAYRPEKRFADAVKGLHLYGAEVVRPSEMVTISCLYYVDANT